MDLTYRSPRGGKPPFGFRAVDGEMVAVPHEYEMRQEIFRMWDAGYPTSKIAEFLNSRGYRQPQGKKEFTRHSVDGIIRRSKLSPRLPQEPPVE